MFQTVMAGGNREWRQWTWPHILAKSHYSLLVVFILWRLCTACRGGIMFWPSPVVPMYVQWQQWLVHRSDVAGKSITDMLLWSHQMTASSLQLCSYSLCFHFLFTVLFYANNLSSLRYRMNDSVFFSLQSCVGSQLTGFPLTWKVRELIWSGNFVGGQGILVACERKRRFLSTFQGKVATC